MTDSQQNIEEHLELLDARETELREKCCYVSSLRISKEIRNAAKVEKLLGPYVNATFSVMNNSPSLLDPVQTRDASIEMISILESEDRARSIDPDLDQSHYEQLIHWYSSCSYDNLAKATGMLKGYNSDGMHECIAEGINVCRRTGKLQCIVCFREYATDVYAAADDLDMAMHYARVGIAHTNRGPHDRRYVGAKDLLKLQILKGELAAACETVMQMLEFAEIWHSPYAGRVSTMRRMRKLGLLTGEQEKWAALATESQPPEGEAPYHEYEEDELRAIEALCNRDTDSAIEILEKWDHQLTQQQCLSDWFQNRLQLIIAWQLAGDNQKVEKLSQTLREKAEKARDYLSLRCLSFILDPMAPQLIVPAVAAPDKGPFAVEADAAEKQVTTANASDESPEEQENEAAAAASEDEPKPSDALAELMRRWGQMQVEAYKNPGEAAFETLRQNQDQLLSDLLELPSEPCDQIEACYRLNFASFLVGESQAIEVWNWAKALIANHRNDATALNLFAKLGTSLRFGPDGASVEKLISEKQLATMFRKSLDMDPNGAKNFMRAGDFFRYMENLGEAERCYARGFRLDRSNAEIANSLAEIYRRTERERDAVTVLDMAIRESESPQPDLYWQAAILAHSIDQHESTLTYLDAYEKAAEEAPVWLNYYRASSLIKLDRNEEAVIAAESELQLNPDSAFGSIIHLVVAGLRLGKAEALEKLETVVNTKLSDVAMVSPKGISSLFETLWPEVAKHVEDESVRTKCEDYLLASGLAPDTIFSRTGEAKEGLTYFRVHLKQPVGSDWSEMPCCLASETEFIGYEVAWGVLAANEEEAVKLVDDFQKRCYSSAEYEIVEVAAMDQHSYTDAPGVVWQGFREGIYPEAS